MSKREDVINAIFYKISRALDVPVKKNEAIPQKIPKEGIIFIRDGHMNESTIILSSPKMFILQHIVEIEIVVQDVSSEIRDRRIDELLTQVAQLLSQDPTLTGIVDYQYPEIPEFMEETIDGAQPIKAVVLPVVVEYAASMSVG